MEPWQEPVRGSPLPTAAFTLPGIDHVRGLGRLWSALPPFHLTGLRATQGFHGSVVLSMPVTPWLSHPDGALDVGFMAAAAPWGAAWSTLGPRQTLEPIHLSYSPLRRISPTSATLIGRAHVVRTAPYWVYAEGTVEDGEGRAVANATGHFRTRDVDLDVPSEVPPFAPIGRPTYPTPDPYERAVPADRYAAFHLFPQRGGVEAIRMMLQGEAPRAPLYELLGIEPVDIRTGAYTSELTTSGWLQATDVQVHPSSLAAFCTDNCGAATWSLTEGGVRLATLHCALTLAGAPPSDGRRLRAHSEATWIGDGLITAALRLLDGDNLIGTGSMTSLIRPVEEVAPEPATRVLATVLFTDIVDSTSRAEQFGDARWKEVLAEHHEITRVEIERARGRLVKSTGDGVLVTFDSPTNAIHCARAIRDAVRRLQIEIRAGLHTGDVDVTGGDVAGIAVHTAARVETAAGAGEVWVTDTVKALATGGGLTFKDRGRHALKGLEEELQLWSVEG